MSGTRITDWRIQNLMSLLADGKLVLMSLRRNSDGVNVDLGMSQEIDLVTMDWEFENSFESDTVNEVRARRVLEDALLDCAVLEVWTL